MRPIFMSAIPLDAKRVRVVITDDRTRGSGDDPDDFPPLASFTCDPENVPALVDMHLVSVLAMDGYPPSSVIDGAA